MNLKYYLRGLGLGIIVTAVILSLSSNQKEKLSDAEIIERAKALGMIENTVLTENTVEDQDASNLEVVLETELSNQSEEESETKEQITEQTQVDDNEGAKETASAQEVPAETETNLEESAETGAEETLEEPVAAEQEEALEESLSIEAEDVLEESTATEDENEQAHETVTDKVLQIVSGDTSYSVAAKLVDLGLVDSTYDYDQYLCQNGYDKKIRTGSFVIMEGATGEEIAQMITGVRGQ